MSFYVPPGGPPQMDPISKEIYGRMGEANIYKMTADFYAKLEQSPIRHLFEPDMVAASKTIGAYFVELFGGPPAFTSVHGTPMLRKRHMRFQITTESRDIWLSCFKSTLSNATTDYHFPAAHLPHFITFLEQFSAWMVNHAENGSK